MAKGKRRQGQQRQGQQRQGQLARSRSNGAGKVSKGLRPSLGGNSLSRSLHMEQLEDKRLLALYVVNNLGDLDGDGDVVVGSLRQAVELSNTEEGFDTIIFADFLFDVPGPYTIALDGRENGGALNLTDEDGVDIFGPGANVLTVFAGGTNRIFQVDDTQEDNSASVTISGLTLSGGSPRDDDADGLGGAILNNESLTLRAVDISNNSAKGGGGVHNGTGFLSIENSLIRNNTAQRGGGGVQTGIAEQDDNLPTTTILNSTLTGNVAIGIPDGEQLTGYGGGVLNLAGVVNIEQSTLYGNSASVEGGGSATQGFEAEVDDETGEPTVTSGPATTNIRSSIIVGNTVADDPNDVGSIGMTEGDEMTEPAPLEPQINSLGFNLFGKLTHPTMSANLAVILPPGGMGDVADVDPTTVFVDDPNAMDPVAWLNDFGGVLPVFMPSPTKPGGLQAIDHGDPLFIQGDTDQRGFQFVRAADPTGPSDLPFMDIGAAEVQPGNFVVTTLVDDSDGRYADVPVSEDFFPINFLTFAPDFSLREAIEFAEKNFAAGLLDPSTITFSEEILTDPTLNTDPTPATPALTIQLTLGELLVAVPMNIQGPSTFDLEVDAGGNDLTPLVNNGDGTRVFTVTEKAEISNLMLRGGDQQEFGGGIFTSNSLTLRNVTVFDNFTTGSGGGVYVAGGDLFVESSTIHDNLSARSGGGIYIVSGSTSINNSTISGNLSTFHGGGVANADGTLRILHSTITLNTAASTLGSGVASFRDATATTKIRSSIISKNAINDVQHVLPGTSNIISSGYNLIGDGNAVLAGLFSETGDQIFADPKLAPLTRLGGLTPVHRLLPGSPAVDAGDPAAGTAGGDAVPLQDQRGFPFDRIENGVRIDIGSFEVQEDVLLVGDVATDPDAGYPTFIAALAESNLTPTKETIVFLPTWLGEIFVEDLVITDSVDIVGITGFFFFSTNLIINDNDVSNLLDVSIENFRFDTNTHIDNHENLTLTNMEFVDNTSFLNGGAIAHQNGKLTIEEGNFIGNSSSGDGGAIYAISGDVEINNSFISGSSAGTTGGKGGAIYIKDGDFTSDYLYLTGNSAPGATGAGGAVYANNSAMLLTNATISGNSTSGSNSRGGALAAKNSNIILIDSAIALNSTLGSQSSGGGLSLEGGSLNVQNSNFSLNKTFGQVSSGGAISSVNTDVTITGSSINRNEVNGLASHGGGVYAVGGKLTIRDSSVVNNSANAAGSNGGGVFTDTNLGGSQTASIFNSTVSGNTAALRGGGVFNADGLLKIQYSTISENSVPFFGNGGGVASLGNASSTRTEVRSSIIAGNFSTGDTTNPNSDVDSVAGLSNSFVSLGYNVIGKGVSQTVGAFNQVGDQTNIVDPGLSPLAVDPTSFTFFHALTPASPAISAGDPSAVAGVGEVPTYDQRGAGSTRVSRGRIDIGSYESNFSPVQTSIGADFDNDGDVDGADFLSWQRGVNLPAAPSGDANNDGSVDGVDLGIWGAEFGTGSGLGALAAVSGGEQESLIAAVTTSEPLIVSAVSTPSSRPLTGLTLDSVVVSSAVSTELLDSAENKETIAAAKDQLFAALSPQAASLSYGGPEVSYQVAEQVAEEPLNEELEVTVEDQIFELLGADA